MRRNIFLILILSVIIIGCGSDKEVDNNSFNQPDEIMESSPVPTIQPEEIKQEIGEEKAREIAFSWYKENHFEFQPDKEDKYSFQFTENHEDIYGEESYLLVMFLEGKQAMYFAVTMQTGKLYLSYGVGGGGDFFVPVDKIKILDHEKEKKKAELLVEKLEKTLNETELVYFDTIQRKNKKYFVYGKFESANLKDIYVMNATTEEIFDWKFDKDRFKEVGAIYGKWKIIDKVGHGYVVGEFSMEDYEGGIVTIDKDYMECDLPMGKYRLENPEYKLTKQTENEFLVGTKVSVENIFGFTPDKIQMVEVNPDYYGFTLFWIKDETHLIFCAPVSLLAEKVE